MTENNLAPPDAPRLSSTWIAQRQERVVIEVAWLRRKQIWRRRALIAMASAAILAIVIVAGLGGLGGSPAYAGWSATPTQARESQLAAASSSCQASWAKLPQLGLRFDQGPLPPRVLADVRGPYSALLYIDSQASYVCFARLSSGALGFFGGDGSFSSVPSAADPVTISSPAVMTDKGAPFRLVTGRATNDVTSIALTLNDGTVVTPTLGAGNFLAWWPSTATIVSTTFVAHGSVHHLG